MIQTENDYKKEVFIGDIGTIEKIDPVEQEVFIQYDDRLVMYDFGELDEVSLAYAVTALTLAVKEIPSRQSTSLARRILSRQLPTRSLPITPVPIDYCGRSRRFSS